MLQARAQLGHIKVIGLAAILGLSLSTGSAAACSVAAWTGSGTATDANANETKRYKGECALEASVADGIYVEEATSFSSENEVKTIFYVNADDATASGNVVIMSLTGAGGSSVDVVLNGNNVSLVSGSNSSPTIQLNSGWNSISVDWSASSNSTITVAKGDESSSQTLTGANSGTVSGVQLGAVSGGGSGQLYFDAFVANRETAPPRELNCDADGSGGSINLDDAIATVEEVLGLGTATGTPDCEEDGDIDLDDAIATVEIVLGL